MNFVLLPTAYSFYHGVAICLKSLPFSVVNRQKDLVQVVFLGIVASRSLVNFNIKKWKMKEKTNKDKQKKSMNKKQ